MFKTYSKKISEVEHKWVEIDATEVPVGRLATFVATRLSGKYQPSFTPSMDSGDHVVIINVEKAVLTGNKVLAKKYWRHTGFPGGIKNETAAELQVKNPAKIVEQAVYGMLPKNKLQSVRMKRLHLFVGENHDHAAQKPEKLTVKGDK